MSNGEGRSLHRKIRYEDCSKNHALSTKKFAIDGCQKFMANKREGVSQLLCDACGCHRSFHKRRVIKDRSADEKIKRYAGCNKNHVLNEKSYSRLLDGCCEFMACQGEQGSREAFICHGCGCHRNFHQMEEEEKEEDQVAAVAAAPPRRSLGSDDGTMYDSEEYYDD